MLSAAALRRKTDFALALATGSATITPMIMTRRHLLGLGAAFLSSAAVARTVPLVFAAASLKNVLDDLARATPMRLSYAGSGVLARQISLGAPADIFISANPKWMAAVEAGGRLSAPPVDLVSNRLVVIANTPKPGFSLTDLQSAGRIAMGLAEAVPAGQYAKAAFEKLGLWKAVKPNAVQTENVRAALALVARGEVPFGVVYRTDALADPKVHVVASIPPEAHPPIVYQAGLIVGSTALETFKQLSGPDTLAVFKNHGFVAL